MLLKCLAILSISFMSIASANEKQHFNGFTHKQLTNELFVLKSENSNTNIGIFIGDEFILLIDPVVGEENNRLLVKAIKEVSEKPIKYVVNTHAHNDHRGANSFYIELGASIILNKNGQFYSDNNLISSKDSHTIDMGSETINLLHFISHSTDDILIYFPKSNSIFMGDTYMHDAYPHAFAGGSKGLFKVINKTFSLSNTSTNIVTAHGRFITKKPELTAFKNNSVLWYKKLKQLSDNGKTIEDILKNNELVKISEMFRPFSLDFFDLQVRKTLAAELLTSK